MVTYCKMATSCDGREKGLKIQDGEARKRKNENGQEKRIKDDYHLRPASLHNVACTNKSCITSLIN